MDRWVDKLDILLNLYRTFKNNVFFYLLFYRNQSSLEVCLLPHIPPMHEISLIFLKLLWLCSLFFKSQPHNIFIFHLKNDSAKEKKYWCLLEWKNKHSQVKFSRSFQQELRTLVMKFNKCTPFPLKDRSHLQPALLYIKCKSKVEFRNRANS